mmetsp:Transcript_42700/g.117851  ORF Transcript_42700/g.117851 Transcript_42700/m.117851 type:complete len:296 (+) Transcript_42700:576-1463(+)
MVRHHVHVVPADGADHAVDVVGADVLAHREGLGDHDENARNEISDQVLRGEAEGDAADAPKGQDRLGGQPKQPEPAERSDGDRHDRHANVDEQPDARALPDIPPIDLEPRRAHVIRSSSALDVFLRRRLQLDEEPARVRGKHRQEKTSRVLHDDFFDFGGRQNAVSIWVQEAKLGWQPVLEVERECHREHVHRHEGEHALHGPRERRRGREEQLPCEQGLRPSGKHQDRIKQGALKDARADQKQGQDAERSVDNGLDHRGQVDDALEDLRRPEEPKVKEDPCEQILHEAEPHGLR